jgi:hypothetical protein
MNKQLGVELLVDKQGQLIDEEGFYYETYFINEDEAYAYCHSFRESRVSPRKSVYPLIDASGKPIWAIN